MCVRKTEQRYYNNNEIDIVLLSVFLQFINVICSERSVNGVVNYSVSKVVLLNVFVVVLILVVVS